MFHGPSSEVQIGTRPAAAHCELSGRDGFAMEVETPATVTLPHAAAPITVSCQAPGFRRTVNSLYTSGNGWRWGNSAFLVMTGGAAALGLIVDEAVGSGVAYRKDFTVDLDTQAPRTVQATERNGGSTLHLRTP